MTQQNGNGLELCKSCNCMTHITNGKCGKCGEGNGWEEEYREIFGENHHEICEGKECVCHVEVIAFIKAQRLEAQKEVLDEIWNEVEEERLKGKYVGLELPISLTIKFKRKLKELSHPEGTENIEESANDCDIPACNCGKSHFNPITP